MKLLILLGATALLTSATCQNGADQTIKKESAMPSTELKKESPALAQNPANQQVAVFGGGCFWCVEAIYQDLKGVSKVRSGYAGGSGANPSYREVCSGLSGHAEVIEITYDPSVIAFRDLCDIFFTVHDPTTLNRQGADVGTQYRSVIFYKSPEQKADAEAAKKAAAEIWDNPIVTEIAADAPFYVAETHHQNYFKDNPDQGYCQIVIAPKVKKFRQKYAEKLKQ